MASESPAPLVSVITVCFNAMTVLPNTVASLRAQDQSNFEWVVVDGASTDGSTQWLALQQPDVFVCETDAGIFDAMNKAVALARGEWLFFLNAGDAFADKHALAEMGQALRLAETAGVVFGDVIYFGDSGERRHRFHWLTRRRLLFGDLCHQAAFVRRKLFQAHGGFDTSLRWNADFDWFVRVGRAGVGLRYVRRDVARFQDAGAHAQAKELHVQERHRVHSRYIPMPLWWLGHFALRIELKFRRWFGQMT